MWLVDPVTREPLPALPSREGELAYRKAHWRPGWRTGIERDERGIPVRIWFAECRDACCASIRVAS
jgi:hypothetical protein